MAKYIKTEEGYKKFATVTYDKMDKTDPTGTGSFSMNRKTGTVVGVNSHAEGERTTASGGRSHAEGYQAIASGEYSHAEGNDTTASGGESHAEGERTTASGGRSHAEGSETVASGEYSHAEGLRTTASREQSHAEGYHTTASGEASHAEGYLTTASGFCSHAEGYQSRSRGKYSHAEGGSTNAFSSVVTTTNPTTDSIITAWETKKFSVAHGFYSHIEGQDNLALGDYSHAEGYWTTAKGNNSHAEGDATIASGYSSHAEGSYTTASGSQSHAEGDHTTANGEGSHVQGKYNIEDTSNTYADIIGNGTSDTARSNAATVDWSGNAWFAGDVYTGSTSGTNKDDGSKKLATEEYVNSSIAAGGTDISLGLTSAAVGQTIKVKAVDESGKPTAWEAADQDVFICTITGNGSAGNPYVCDRTFREIEQAVAAGKIVYARSETKLYSLMYTSGVSHRFDTIIDGKIESYVMNATGALTSASLQLQNAAGMVTSLSIASTDTQYPSAKCVYNELEKKQGKPEIYEAIFSPSGWSINDSGYHEQSLTVEGLKRDYILPPDIDIKLSGTNAQQDAQLLADWTHVSIAQVDNDTLVLQCVGDPPTSTLDMPVIVRVWQ